MPSSSKVTAAVWGPLEKTIITGHEKGELMVWDVKVGLTHTFVNNEIRKKETRFC